MVEQPPPAHLFPTIPSDTTTAASPSDMPAPPRLHVRIADIVAVTPAPWQYARTRHRVERALEQLYRAYGAQPSDTASSSAAAAEHQQLQGAGTCGTACALQALEECLVYSHMDVRLGQVQVLCAPPSPASRPAPPLQPLLPPLHVAASLATSRVPMATQLPATSACVEVGGWEAAALRASQVSDLLRALDALRDVLAPAPPHASPTSPQSHAHHPPPAPLTRGSVPAPALSLSHADLGLPPLRPTSQLQLCLQPLHVVYTDDNNDGVGCSSAAQPLCGPGQAARVGVEHDELQEWLQQQQRPAAAEAAAHMACGSVRFALGRVKADVTLCGNDAKVG